MSARRMTYDKLGRRLSAIAESIDGLTDDLDEYDLADEALIAREWLGDARRNLGNARASIDADSRAYVGRFKPAEES